MALRVGEVYTLLDPGRDLRLDGRANGAWRPRGADRPAPRALTAHRTNTTGRPGSSRGAFRMASVTWEAMPSLEAVFLPGQQGRQAARPQSGPPGPTDHDGHHGGRCVLEQALARTGPSLCADDCLQAATAKSVAAIDPPDESRGPPHTLLAAGSFPKLAPRGLWRSGKGAVVLGYACRRAYGELFTMPASGGSCAGHGPEPPKRRRRGRLVTWAQGRRAHHARKEQRQLSCPRSRRGRRSRRG